MKKPILLLIVANLFSLNALNAHADWDPALEAREAAARYAEQQRTAKEKAETDKMIRDANQKYRRDALGKEAVGKSDAEVARIFQQRQGDAIREGNAASVAGRALAADVKKFDASTRAERDAQMKGMTGKSGTELENMSDTELEAFAKDMQRKYGK